MERTKNKKIRKHRLTMLMNRLDVYFIFFCLVRIKIKAFRFKRRHDCPVQIDQPCQIRESIHRNDWQNGLLKPIAEQFKSSFNYERTMAKYSFRKVPFKQKNGVVKRAF